MFSNWSINILLTTSFLIPVSSGIKMGLEEYIMENLSFSLNKLMKKPTKSCENVWENSGPSKNIWCLFSNFKSQLNGNKHDLYSERCKIEVLNVKMTVYFCISRSLGNEVATWLTCINMKYITRV